MKLLNLSAQQLLKKLKNKQLTSVELCKAYINQKKNMIRIFKLGNILMKKNYLVMQKNLTIREKN